MSEVYKHGNTSGLQVRVSRNVSKMSPANQTGCSANLRSHNACSRGSSLLSRSRIVNRTQNLILSETRQNPLVKSVLGSCKKEIEMSKSTPDLYRTSRLYKQKISPLLAPVANIKKINSWESVTKTEKAPVEKLKVQPLSRIPMKNVSQGKLKPIVNNVVQRQKIIEVAKKPPIVHKKIPVKSIETKRKYGCVESRQGQSKNKPEVKVVPSTNLLRGKSVHNRTEECQKIVKKILLDKKTVEGEKKPKRNSTEFEDSIETFNSEEMADILSNDSQLKTSVDTSKISQDIDKSSKRNSSELDDSIGSFFSDQMVFSMSKSTEFLNLGGSEMNFFSENPLGLSASENLENLTPGFSGLGDQMDRTPSAEDLPMECEMEPELGNLTLPGPEAISARSTSPTEEVPQESISSRTPNAPISIITSITSIMSLDTGYQGDGELSRPESRNTENESRLMRLPIAENGIPVKTINFDDGKTMTDSDFFTESDADVHDDLSVAAAEIGSGKGDRKAQVIDGTLYGGGFTHASVNHENEQNGNLPNHLLIRMTSGGSNSNEDMESSGIYSDLEKKPEEIWLKEKESISYLGMITEQMKTIQTLALSVAEKKRQQETASDGIVQSSSGESSNTVCETTGNGVVSPARKQASGTNSSESSAKKAKTTSRHVSSKTNLLPPSKENELPRPKVKMGKWDAVMDKIAQGKEENKYSPSKFRDIKSKVFQNVGPLFNSRKNQMESRTTAHAPPPNTQLKPRSRRNTRVRSSESSLISPKSKQSRTVASTISSQRSSLSDISLSENVNSNSTNRGSKKRNSLSPNNSEATNSEKTPIRKLNNNNDDTLPSANSGNSQTDLQNGNVVRTPSGTALTKSPSIRKATTPRRNETIVGSNTHRSTNIHFKDTHHNGIVPKSGSNVITNHNNSQTPNRIKSIQSFQNKPLKQVTRGTNSTQTKDGLKDVNKAYLKQLKYNSKAFESLAVLLSYCVHDLDVFSVPYIKNKLETEKQKFIQAQSDIEELQSRLIQVREELNEKEIQIVELNNDKVNLGEKSENFRRLVEELENNLKIVTEQKCETESELLRECESIRCLRRELSNRTDKFENEKDSLVNSLSEAKRENGILKSANREIKEEYDRCLVENQRLVELISKNQNELVRIGKENVEGNREESIKRKQRNEERSPERAAIVPVAVDKSFRNSTTASPNFNANCLESEVESLRQVLALKTDEVTELRRQELSLRENADRVPKLLSTITMLEGKVEDLQTQLSSQTETVRDLFKSNDQLEEELKSANIQKTRLSHKNEELQYKLKQYAEAMKQLATQKNFSEKNLRPDSSPLKSSPRRSDGNLDDTVKSHMKAVVEKSDSMSYMLEMTEDTSEIVTNIIRRAESLRSTSRDYLVKKKRTKASSVSSTDSRSPLRNFSEGDDFRPEMASTPNLSPDSFEVHRHPSSPKSSPAVSPTLMFPMNKVVKLNQADFSTDSIELATDECEVIEITKSFDKRDDKNGEMVMSTSSSSSNGSNFDIESDVFSNIEADQNIHELDEDTENSELNENGSFRRDAETEKPVLPVYPDESSGNVSNSYLSNSKNFITVSGGEAMIGLSSDDEDIGKLKRVYN